MNDGWKGENGERGGASGRDERREIKLIGERRGRARKRSYEAKEERSP